MESSSLFISISNVLGSKPNDFEVFGRFNREIFATVSPFKNAVHLLVALFLAALTSGVRLVAGMW